MMSSGRPLIIYIHGFNSSPASEKAQQFSNFCQESGKYDIAVPEVSHDPQAAVTQLEALFRDAPEKPILLVGSSLGGYYATWLAEKHQCKAALVNPAISPVKTLGEEFLGPQKTCIRVWNMNIPASMLCTWIRWTSIHCNILKIICC